MIKNIVFDFGGVLLDLDYSKTDAAFKRLFGLSFDGRNYPPDFQIIFDDYEKGAFGEGSFFHRLQRKTLHIIREYEILRAWNAMLLGIPEDSLTLLRHLGGEYQVILLSNTNHTHLLWLHRHIQEKYGITDFESRFFDAVYYSFKIGMRKPDTDIYEYVLNHSRLLPEQTLFIDDNRNNLIAPANLGIHTVQHDPEIHISKKIIDYIKAAES